MVIEPSVKVSYKDIVKENISNSAPYSFQFQGEKTLDTPHESESGNKVILMPKDKARIYRPWRFSVIIKVVGKRFNHHYLKTKLTELWKIQEGFALIDLGLEFYTIKFNSEEYQMRALHKCPWFIAGAYISMRNWELNFVPSKTKIQSMVIWIRLPHLLTKFYDVGILEKVGQKIGTLVKIDECTSTTLWGRYVRICVQIPLEMQIQTSVIIGSHQQDLLYEGDDFLFKVCGKLGHTISQCKLIPPKRTQVTNSNTPTDTSTLDSKQK